MVPLTEVLAAAAAGGAAVADGEVAVAGGGLDELVDAQPTARAQPASQETIRMFGPPSRSRRQRAHGGHARTDGSTDASAAKHPVWTGGRNSAVLARRGVRSGAGG